MRERESGEEREEIQKNLYINNGRTNIYMRESEREVKKETETER